MAKFLTASILNLTLFLGSASAGNIIFYPAQTMGSGCPSGTASSTASPDGRNLSIIFDNLISESGAGVRSNRKSCSLSIPIDLPAQTSLNVVSADFRGFRSLTAAARGSLLVSFSLQGQQPGTKVIREKPFSGSQEGEFSWSVPSPKLNSPCGGRIYLKVTVDLSTVVANSSESMLLSLDSSDLSNPTALSYRFAQAGCSR